MMVLVGQVTTSISIKPNVMAIHPTVISDRMIDKQTNILILKAMPFVVKNLKMFKSITGHGTSNGVTIRWRMHQGRVKVVVKLGHHQLKLTIFHTYLHNTS